MDQQGLCVPDETTEEGHILGLCLRYNTKNWGFLGGRLGADDFDRPEAAESKHDSKDDSNGMADVQAPACKWCCCQFLVRYSDETDPGDGGGEGQ